jgi:cystathionine beta-lyase/cystathionine gamma-synthase
VKFRTLSVHGPERRKHDGAVVDPIFLSTTYAYAGTERYDENRYGRLSNTPTHVALGRKLAALEGTETAVVLGSGMAAISTALLALVPEGGTLAVQDQVYGGTHAFLAHHFEKLGRKLRWLPMETFDDRAAAERAVRGASAVYVEAISNPLLKIPNLENVVAVARTLDVPSVIDNTFLSPALFRPAAMGFDVVLHSATKYLNGHSDVIAGAVAGSRKLVDPIVRWSHHLGGSLDPFACYLLDRGLKTLTVRLDAQVAAAERLARALATFANVERVVYPGLDDHPHVARARTYFRAPGAMVSFVSKLDPKETDRRLAELVLATVAPSLGGVESLVCRPAVTSHSGMAPEERRRVGVDDRLVRISVGLEDPDDLVADFARVFGDG